MAPLSMLLYVLLSVLKVTTFGYDGAGRAAVFVAEKEAQGARHEARPAGLAPAAGLALAG
jgi:hypothetical protein